MGLKCPSCSFDSPDDALYCDFCKEPFRKKPAVKPAVAPIPKTTQAPAMAQDQAEILEIAKKLSKGTLDKIPPELSTLEEKIPTLPPWLSTVTWIFLAVCLISAMIMGAMTYQRYRLHKENAAQSVRIP